MHYCRLSTALLRLLQIVGELYRLQIKRTIARPQCFRELQLNSSVLPIIPIISVHKLLPQKTTTKTISHFNTFMQRSVSSLPGSTCCASWSAFWCSSQSRPHPLERKSRSAPQFPGGPASMFDKCLSNFVAVFYALIEDITTKMNRKTKRQEDNKTKRQEQSQFLGFLQLCHHDHLSSPYESQADKKASWHSLIIGQQHHHHCHGYQHHRHHNHLSFPYEPPAIKMESIPAYESLYSRVSAAHLG